MYIKEIVGREIKINANSITVRNEEGKTCGVVRNVTSLYNIQANKQFDINSKLRKNGIRSMDFDIKKNILKQIIKIIIHIIVSILVLFRPNIIAFPIPIVIAGNRLTFITVINLFLNRPNNVFGFL